MSCKKAWTALTEKGVSVGEEVDARKEVYNGEAAYQILAGAREVVVASGKKVMEFEIKNADRNEVIKRITGPTGNLRAPTLRVGDVYFVGFNPEMYDRFG